MAIISFLVPPRLERLARSLVRFEEERRQKEFRLSSGLTPGTKMIVTATEAAVVLRKAGLLRKFRAMFSKVPIRNIE